MTPRLQLRVVSERLLAFKKWYILDCTTYRIGSDGSVVEDMPTVYTGISGEDTPLAAAGFGFLALADVAEEALGGVEPLFDEEVGDSKEAIEFLHHQVSTRYPQGFEATPTYLWGANPQTNELLIVAESPEKAVDRFVTLMLAHEGADSSELRAKWYARFAKLLSPMPLVTERGDDLLMPFAAEAGPYATHQALVYIRAAAQLKLNTPLN